MEMIDGDTLHERLEFCEDSVVYVLPEKLSFTFDKNFLRRFFTLYLLTLLAQKGYSHGDSHTGNIMLTHYSSSSPFFKNSLGHLLTSHNMNVVPYIIDFGEGALLTSLTFEELSEKILSKEILSEVKKIFPFYHSLYDIVCRTVQVRLIISIINEYLRYHKYVEAILITTMCSSNNKNSMFQKALKHDTSVYNHLFTINEEEAEILNSLIKQAIDDRKILETRLQQWQIEPVRKKQRSSGGHYQKKINNTRKIKKLKKIKKIKTRKIRKIRKTRKTRKTRN